MSPTKGSRNSPAFRSRGPEIPVEVFYANFMTWPRDTTRVNSSLEDVEFLSRSESRITVLEALNEEPLTRDELKMATEASRTTLSRMLADFEERGWIERSDRRYALTPEGTFVASEVTRLLENMETAKQLDETLRWLPTDEFDFDLRRLRDAEVFTVHWNDPASMRRLAERLDDASRVRSIDNSVSREFVDILRDLVIERGISYQGILAPEAVEIVRDHPELRTQFGEIVGANRTSVYRSDSDASHAMVVLVDDQAAVCNHDTDGPRLQAILGDDEAFHAWVESYFESIRADAEPLTADVFAR